MPFLNAKFRKKAKYRQKINGIFLEKRGKNKKFYYLNVEFLRTYQLDIMLILTGICAMITLLVFISKSIPRSRKTAMIVFEFSATLLLVADRLAYFYRGVTTILGWWMVRISNFSVFFLSLCILYGVNMYLKDLFTHEGKMDKPPTLLRISTLLLIIAFVQLIISQLTGLYYSFDAENRYQRSSGMFICFVFPMLTMIFMMVSIAYHRKSLNKRIFIPLFLFTIIPIIATVIQIFSYGISLTNLTTVGMAAIIYIFALQDLNESVRQARQHEIELLGHYNEELEKAVEERTQELKEANQKVESLLLNILPKDIAEELAKHPNNTIAKEYPNATVLFADIVGFTKMSDKMSALETVKLLNTIVSIVDEISKHDGIEKIKTIGDSYMAVTGLNQDSSGSVTQMVHFAKRLIHDIEIYNKEADAQIQIRIGINTGSLVGGVIGKAKFIYDVWGDTVNVASRMENSGEPMQIHITEKSYLQCQDDFPNARCVVMDIKGKGPMKTYYV